MTVLINFRITRAFVGSERKCRQVVQLFSCGFGNRQQLQSLRTLRISSLPSEVASDMESAVKIVRKYDPSGYLPGTLLPNVCTKLGYFAVRAFWVETGLLRSTNSIVGPSVPTDQKNAYDKPQGDIVIERWRERILSLFDNERKMLEHPTLRLLDFYNSQNEKKLTLSLLLNILESRALDFNVKQYSTVQDLIDHSKLSCGSLMKLVLECADVYENPSAIEAANLIGVCHGITNALRTSIPIASQTGKIIIPEELCIKYGVRSPRFLLSALGQGDEKCKEALNKTVHDLSQVARGHLTKARLLREQILLQKRGQEAMAVFLPGVASETFLNRLQSKNYDLTDVELRNISFLEKGTCSVRMIAAWIRKTY
jgi:hypothetical protein